MTTCCEYRRSVASTRLMRTKAIDSLGNSMFEQMSMPALPTPGSAEKVSRVRALLLL